MYSYINRELSWLKFNERVLMQAGNKNLPLGERLNFISIYQSNLDEFFMVRVGSLMDQQLLSKSIRDNKTNMTSAEQIEAIVREAVRLNRLKDTIYKELVNELNSNGIVITRYRDLDNDKRAAAQRYFEKKLKPLIYPTVISRRQPFPFLTNKGIYALAVLSNKSGKEKLGIVSCGKELGSRLIDLGDNVYLLMEELILHYLNKTFSSYQVVAKTLIRVTRNADIDADSLYDEDLDYRDFMEKLIRKRKRLSPVRLEIFNELDEDIVSLLCEYSKTDKKLVMKSQSPLDLSFLFGIQDLLRSRSELFYPKRIPQRSSEFVNNVSIMKQVRNKDKLLSYPFESMKPFLDLLNEAANDKDVISIKMTLYRVASHSKIIESLIEAAENGKNVVVLVELKARFDEANNIEWSRRLEEAGCQVIYGLDGYKVHSKICLITSRVNGNIAYITQIGTGNYNEKTARLYTDLSLISADKKLGEEASAFFQALAKGELIKNYETMMVAPLGLQSGILDLIEEQIKNVNIGKKAYIGLKVNSMTDKTIIDALYKASNAGVKIDLIIRGICCLVPGVKGQSENIRVISIVGRLLEHSRIYIFGEDVYIASADMMTRNTLRRVEIALKIRDEDIKKRIIKMFNTMLSDNVQASLLRDDGLYEKVKSSDKAVNSQEEFYDEAYRNADAQSETVKNKKENNTLFKRFIERIYESL